MTTPPAMSGRGHYTIRLEPRIHKAGVRVCRGRTAHNDSVGDPKWAQSWILARSHENGPFRLNSAPAIRPQAGRDARIAGRCGTAPAKGRRSWGTGWGLACRGRRIGRSRPAAISVACNACWQKVGQAAGSRTGPSCQPGGQQLGMRRKPIILCAPPSFFSRAYRAASRRP